MQITLTNASVFEENVFSQKNISVVVSADKDILSLFPADHVFQFNNCVVFPGFVDVHVHLREPGFSYKETIKTGTLAAAHGGYTAVCSMPNLNPAPDSREHLLVQMEKISNDAVISVYPYGTITKCQLGEELSDMGDISADVAGFSDDGRGVQSDDMMRQAMLKAKELDKIIVAHCEVNDLLRGGYIHDGEYAKKHGHRGICSESEWAQIARDIELVKETGCKYHVCHISTKESVDIIRKAKAEGVDITCETGPHYLVLNDTNLQEDGRFKMNPPIRGEEDRLALIEGIKDGTIDMIATDHAPHSAEEKSRGLEKSLMGVVGLETALPVLYTQLVKKGIITLEKLVEVMSINPCKRFGISQKDCWSVWNLEEEYTVDPDNFLSMGKATPFRGDRVFGKCLLTVHNGKIVWSEN
ncbi:MAG: dihydroorotase [Clostridia bacterium]|nr:dihydroorotase [Clostridia bacterium]